MSKEQFPNARAARQHLDAQGYKAITPGSMEGALCWVRPDEDGYYLVAKNTDGARLMHYAGKPEQLPAGSIVSCDNDDKKPAGEFNPERALKGAFAEALATQLDAQLMCGYRDELRTSSHALTTEFRERNDCAVHALRFALDVPYDVAHAALATAGRRYRCGTQDHTLLKALADLGGRIIEQRTLLMPQSRIANNVRPVGRYIVRAATHFFAVVDGVSHDVAPERNRRLRRMWLVSK
jgi:hypothetical protein